MAKLEACLVLAALLLCPVVTHAETTTRLAHEDEFLESNGATMHFLSEDDQPCYVGGKYAGNCSIEKPYLHVFSSTCYATLEQCKKADGDLADTDGSGGCVRCGK